MKTDISAFCADCSSVLAPLPPALEAAALELGRLSRDGTPGQALATLNDLRARLRSLTEKLASQQAYLLIFGPLKSGKSTLVNALSGAYVSEVTSLPGYPCLVYVQHGAAPRFAVTRYNGRESVFADAGVLKDVIADSHVALVQQIRQTENDGGRFDPVTDYPEAIRRVDVKVPVPNLAESNTALVDTPGLYSRMNFGYDVLTREFRDSAACAVFVVKTDNLFLEQVFVEFDQLLDLFSRIFLVINVDSSKRDLHADGALRPSAESAAPEKIVQAFTSLSMSGPLRQAYEQNRVRIHALDLMSAASSVLHPGEPNEEQRQGRERFDTFVDDLTSYLNSSEYTVEFVRDSLRQARLLCGELGSLASSGEMRDRRDRQDALSLQMRILDHRIASVDRLLGVDWVGAFEKFRTEAAAGARTRTAAAMSRAVAETRAMLKRWFGNGESLKELEEQHWDRLLIHTGLQLAEETGAHLEQAAASSFGGAQLSAEAVDDLHRIGINLSNLSAAALGRLDPPEPLESYLIHIPLDEIPIARTFSEWVSFRRPSTLRRAIFGEDLALPVPPEVKAARLPEASREALAGMVEENIRMKFGAYAPEQAERAVYGYVEGFCGGLGQALQEKREQFVQGRQSLQREFDANVGIVALMMKLEGQVSGADAALAQLEKSAPATLAAVPGSPLAQVEAALDEAAARHRSAA